MYFSLAAIVGLGVVLTFCITPMRQEIRDTPFKFGLLLDPRMLALFPLLFGSAFLSGQSFTAMNTIIIRTLGIGSLAFIISTLKGGNIIGTLVSGIAADIWNKSATLIVTVICMCVGIALFVAAQSFLLICIGAALMGISMAAIYPVCLASLRERLQPQEYTHSLGIFHVYNCVGVVSAMLANIWLSESVSFVPSIIALLFAIPGILVFSKLTER